MRIFPLFLAFLLCLLIFSMRSVAYDDGSYCKVYNVSLNATVNDADNDLMTIEFYWGNYTSGDYLFLDDFYNVTTGTNLSVYLPDFWHREIIVSGMLYNVTWLEHNHRYEWFIVGDDGKNITLMQNWFYTCKAWDLNKDGTMDYLDISGIVGHYGERVLPPGAQPWDINEDTYTNLIDLSTLVSHYMEHY